jgi:hypothetical protein
LLLPPLNLPTDIFILQTAAQQFELEWWRIRNPAGRSTIALPKERKGKGKWRREMDADKEEGETRIIYRNLTFLEKHPKKYS